MMVRAMRYAYVNGKRQLHPARIATSDDRGAYRLFDLAPGRYYIQAVRRSAAAYHPAATDPSGAAPVVVAPGEEARAIDVRFRSQGAYRVRIRITNLPDAAALPRQGTELRVPIFIPSLSRRGISANPETVSVAIRGNVAEATDVPPGAYVFSLRLAERSGNTLT